MEMGNLRSQGRCRGLEVDKLYRRISRRALPVHLFRHVCCGIFRLATIQSVADRQTDRQSDRQTDDSMMPWWLYCVQSDRLIASQLRNETENQIRFNFTRLTDLTEDKYMIIGLRGLTSISNCCRCVTLNWPWDLLEVGRVGGISEPAERDSSDEYEQLSVCNARAH